MKERLLQYLACPACEGELALASVVEAEESRGWAEILEGELACQVCAWKYAVRRGVPRFAGVSEIEHDKAATAENFGWQWQHFTQTDERYDEQFRGWLAPVAPEFFQNKTVLEGG